MDLKKKYFLKCLSALLSLCFIFAGVYFFNKKQSSGPISDTEFALDTFVNVTIYDSKDENILKSALELCNYYEDIFSAHKESSELYKLNHRSSDSIVVSDDLADLISKGLYYSKLSNGSFDITIEPVKELWDFKSESPSLPDDSALQEAVKKVDYNTVSLSGNTVTFSDPDTRIDLGAIAKGYIADRIKDYLLSEGIKSAIINLGGNVLCVGKKPNGEDFNIGLQMPFASMEETIGVVNGSDISVVTSGVYERYIEVDGKEYHHILDPNTGYPYDNKILGVSIVSRYSVDGDALSTSCFALGVDKGTELLDSIEGVYGYFILDDLSVVPSSNAPALE